MVTEMVQWYKEHREVLEGDLIHLRRADGRDLDYWMLVNPDGEEKGALVVFNPLDKDLQKNIQVPLYYTGLDQEVLVKQDNSVSRKYQLDRDFSINLPVEVSGQKWAVYFFE